MSDAGPIKAFISGSASNIVTGIIVAAFVGGVAWYRDDAVLKEDLTYLRHGMDEALHLIKEDHEEIATVKQRLATDEQKAIDHAAEDARIYPAPTRR